jgi:hypothetical protein
VTPSIRLCNDAIARGAGFDVGLYDLDLAAVDDDAYASATSLASAAPAGTEVAFSARDINAIGRKVWEDVGLTAHPMSWYYLVLTGDTVGTASGDVSFDVTMLVD